MASLSPYAGTLGLRLAKHLLRRLTFGATRAEMDLFATKTADQAVNDLLTSPPLPPPPLDPLTGTTWVYNGYNSSNSAPGLLYYYTAAWWLDEHIQGTTLSAIQKMTFFLHSIFTSDRTINPVNLFNQLRLFRHYAYGSYKTLSKKISVDNGMLRYLDGRLSSKSNPNENYARELLELFTIGKGEQIGMGNYTTYTEADIQEAARLFTGYRQNLTYQTFDPDTGIPKGTEIVSSHDITNKTFTGAFQGQTIVGQNTASGMLDEVSDFIEMVFGQTATSLNICRKIYRFFVHTQINAEIENDIIVPLAQTLRNNNFNLLPVYQQLFKSQHFFDTDDADSVDETVGAIIKSPMELAAGTIRYFKIPVPDKVTDPDRHYRLFYYVAVFIHMFRQSGFDIFNPPNVSSYPANFQEPAYDKLWINASTLNFRYLYGDMFIDGKRRPGNGSLYTQLDVMAFVNDTANIKEFQGMDYLGIPGPHAGPRIADHLVDELINYLLPESISNARYAYFKDDLLLGSLTEINWMGEWDNYISSGDDSMVRVQIEKLIRGILQSPEYQLA